MEYSDKFLMQKANEGIVMVNGAYYKTTSQHARNITYEYITKRLLGKLTAQEITPEKIIIESIKPKHRKDSKGRIIVAENVQLVLEATIKSVGNVINE